MYIVIYYLLGSALALLTAILSNSVFFALPFAWLSISLFAVSAAYWRSAPQIFRKKQNGSIPLYIRWIFIPFLLGVQLYNSWARRADKVPAIQKIQDNLFLACRLFPSDMAALQREGVKAILDVTAEFDGLDWSSQAEDLAYFNIPVLDHQSPASEDLLRAVNWIDNQLRAERPVVIHCALGRGRSVFVTAAYLLSKNKDLTVDEALSAIRSIRSTANLNKKQLRALTKIYSLNLLDLAEPAWLIANPVAGGGKWQQQRQNIEQQLMPYLQLHLVETSLEISASELSKEAISKGAKTIIACGGDGTLTEVANELVDSQLTLGIIPFGTANALAHVLFGFMSKVNAVDLACEHIIAGTVTRIDTAQCNQQLMLLVTGLGFEHKMIALADREHKNDSGQLAYISGLWQAVNINETLSLMVQIDGKPAEKIEVCSLVVANSAPFTTALAQGGGLPDLHDGKLDLTWLPADQTPASNFYNLAELTVAGLLPGYNAEGVRHAKIETIHICAVSGEDLNFVVDGETYSATELEIKVKPKSLNVLAPALKY
jgi:diacylglycerol kinase (ATP)